MKQIHGNGLTISAVAMVVLAAQPVAAQISQITGVQVSQADGGVNLVLNTAAGDRAQVFTTRRGNALVADIINTQLRLPQGNNFRQANPAPGIAAVEVSQLDANSVRVTVTGESNAPEALPIMRGPSRLTLSVTPSSAPSTANNTPNTPVAQIPVPSPGMNTQPAPAAGTTQPSYPAPPFLPRAVAPPVGDIAISNTDASPSTIDLGTQERVPRLVLRDAPVREVLSLLARAANMNLAFAGPSEEGKDGARTSVVQENTGSTERVIYQRISLDIQNEPVQDVFNHVLRLSGLEANRSGRTIFVGPRLPNSTRDMVVRNIRLNQAAVPEILRVLVNLGAESAVNAEQKTRRVTTQVVGQENDKRETNEDTDLTAQRIIFTDSVPILRGLQVSGDTRTNTITLVGPSKLVEIALSQITPLDVRRRQVAVNVKIVDVNLTGIKDFNSSFSFGIVNNFFSVDGGNASANFGGSRPANPTEAANSVTSTPVIPNPIRADEVFLGDRFFDRNGRPSADPSVSGNPLSVGITNFQPGTPGSPDVYTFNQPSLYQFPKRFLASIQTQVRNQNAKILTDPTLIVQEGQTADVRLTQEVVGNIERQITRGDGTSSETITAKKETVGLTLAVKVDRIDDNGFISLSVAPTVASPQAPDFINTGNGSQRIFLVSTRSLTSGTVRLRDGQTLVLSGIIQDQDRTSVSKLPILGDIPLLGSLFRRTNREKQRNEVIVLLTPQILDDSERSSYGYNYNPSPEVRQMLERRGLRVPRK
ncbi:type IV pilus secretin family protein [Calothrix sp. NIES-3974]|uniref:type IV pilus secretin family protein n=1 Tax=Calothrix sp. NIES-3974 TaxID=2005462 RepID=UPI000B6185F4|nr:type IV pilus secretin family protein [Calothrix sp. NIES-3974]BAZ03713.1 type II and III secretion system protein [Calothrix sp. NIES-3974]